MFLSLAWNLVNDLGICLGSSTSLRALLQFLVSILGPKNWHFTGVTSHMTPRTTPARRSRLFLSAAMSFHTHPMNPPAHFRRFVQKMSSCKKKLKFSGNQTWVFWVLWQWAQSVLITRMNSWQLPGLLHISPSMTAIFLSPFWALKIVISCV